MIKIDVQKYLAVWYQCPGCKKSYSFPKMPPTRKNRYQVSDCIHCKIPYEITKVRYYTVYASDFFGDAGTCREVCQYYIKDRSEMQRLIGEYDQKMSEVAMQAELDRKKSARENGMTLKEAMNLFPVVNKAPCTQWASMKGFAVSFISRLSSDEEIYYYVYLKGGIYGKDGEILFRQEEYISSPKQWANYVIQEETRRQEKLKQTHWQDQVDETRKAHIATLAPRQGMIEQINQKLTNWGITEQERYHFQTQICEHPSYMDVHNGGNITQICTICGHDAWPF